MFSEDPIIDAYALLLIGGYKTITRREAEIFVYLIHGMKNKRIADALCISVKSVRTHRQNLYTDCL